MADLQDRAPEAHLDRERGRARFLREGVAARERSRPRGRALAMSLVAAALAAIAMLIVMRPREALRFELGTTQAGVVGAWIAAPPEAALPIRFSDGSEIRLAASGRARVASINAEGAEIALEKGSIAVSVIHRDKTQWMVRAGPFQVRVVGTRFEVSWDPVSERFVLALHEGAVTVSGPIVGDARPVRAGERITVSPATGTLEMTPINAAPAPAPSPTETSVPPPIEPQKEPPPAPVRAPNPEVIAPRASSSALRSPPHEPSTWRALALDGKYKDALAAAEHEGFDAICAAAGAGDLQALGDAARLAGDTRRAQQAFTAIRARFSGSPEAASAAFILGRIAQDRYRDPATAADWFARYLSEQPGGPFAAEAAGRLVEVKDRMGDTAGALRAAERYLATYPNGSHAAYAQRVVARGADAGTP
ncbi:MAG: FecR domain-containing protein [Minicystis sp.]